MGVKTQKTITRNRKSIDTAGYNKGVYKTALTKNMKKLRNIQTQFREIATKLNQLLEEKLANDAARVEGTNPSPKPRVGFEEGAELTRKITHRSPKAMKWLGLTEYVQKLKTQTGFEGAENWMDDACEHNNGTFRSIQSFVSN